MALTPNSAILPQTPRNAVAQIANADGTNLKALVVGGANASKVGSIFASSTDTTARTVQLIRNIGGTNTSGTVTGGTNYLICSVSIPASSGNAAGTPPVSILNATNIPGVPLDNTGTPYLFVNSGDILCVALLTGAVTSSDVISVHAMVGDF
jgi:hypothetical protein